MNIHVKKQKVQEDMQRVIVSNNYIGTISAATGAGKTKVGVDLCEHVKEAFCKKKSFKVLIAVPTTKLRDDRWPEEFKKWKKEGLLEFINMSCYKSINKIKDEHFDLVILDEAHHITELNSQFFKQNQVDKVLGLTATLPRDIEKSKMLNRYAPVIYEYPLDKALEDGVVSPFKLRVIYYDLDTREKNVQAGNAKNRFYQSERDAYNYRSRRLASYRDRDVTPPKMLLLERMRFLHNIPTKLKVGKGVLKTIDPKKRYLVFGGGIKQIEALCKHTYHSKTNSSDYDKFVAEKINVLGCVQALNEGEDLPNMDGAIIVAFNSNPLSMIQRIGRIIRYRKEHIGEITILCSKDTIEEEWMSKALDAIDSTNIEKYEFKKVFKNNKYVELIKKMK